ncbi:1-deoxy-D-xylulose-5-phosphate synthase [Lachnospiraceae bacterium MD1]|uniref:1-deoxy-D-xylulose-5-phosphate synthase n=1 Tax=Variimorphobacter saccharofermentans TaxID=2755051 RepID=A0A839JYG2_9FIRM|nr:1-deoxy-D-xylulose-5-phosphate synthase [Variimorphobacter saccharofermentans]MBB2182394.1 1-deoxy-D-xylulose-5-phosphate synthase [Variimorphobacter saccharofermentans]
MPRLLDGINNANDIKKIKAQDYDKLAREIRDFLIQNVSQTGGHLASNLGVVELTMALHLFLNLPQDKLIWDVGHQAYTHKVLTGRKNLFSTLRQMDGMSGFPKREESVCDSFDTGHSSTAISAALGLVKARDLNGENNKVVAVLGDGALTGGMAFEAINNAGRLKTNLIIVLNDNNMSISENVGGMANYLAKLRTNSKYTGFKENMENTLIQMPGVGKALVDKLKRSKDAIKYFMLPSMFFEDMGLTYIGPIDGHNISQMITAFEAASRAKKAVVVHVLTRKGKGYKPAEKYPSRYHSVETFDVVSGSPLKKEKVDSYTKVFSDTMLRLAQSNDKLVAITAAMPSGTGLTHFMKQYPDRFFDVGIAEEHAVTFAAGMAMGGYKPVVAIYSTFMQRSYDQIIHDVCINNLPVVFAIDRAGITGRDGKTHQGIFDLSFLSHIPNLTVMAPKNRYELEEMLAYAVSYDGPVAVRYPKGDAYDGLSEYRAPIVHGKSEVLKQGSDIAILALGSMVKTGAEVAETLEKEGISTSLVNVRFASPIDIEIIDELTKKHKILVSMEENVRNGGYGQKVADYLCESKKNIRYINISVPDEYIEHGGVSELHKKLGLDAESIYNRIREELNLLK